MLKSKSTLVVFGDSNVWGTGLKDCPAQQRDFISRVYHYNDDSMPYHIKHSFVGHLARHYKMNILNLAIPGSSNDTVFRRVNEFCMGKYNVDLSECFVMIFWTGVSRREFFTSDYENYYNYSPLFPKHIQAKAKFHKVYSRELWHDKYDQNRLLTYQFSLGGLLESMNIANVQSYAMVQHDSLKYAIKYGVKNLLPTDVEESLCSIVGSGSKKYRFPCHHPTELGHQKISELYIKLLDKKFNS